MAGKGRQHTALIAMIDVAEQTKEIGCETDGDEAGGINNMMSVIIV